MTIASVMFIAVIVTAVLIVYWWSPNRKKRLSRTQQAVTPTKRKARICDIVKKADNTISLKLQDSSGKTMAYTAGQYLTMNVKVNGQALCR